MDNLKFIEAVACAVHEANRAYCLTLGDESQVPWHQSPEWLRTSVRKGVLGVLVGNGPEESHQSWLVEKLETGWKYGPEKNYETKEHPCLLPYEELSVEQRRKDEIFVSICRLLLSAYKTVRGV